MERISGCLVRWKCLVACLFFDESQQPTWPHSRHRRRWTHVSPVLMQSSQTSVSVDLDLICFKWLQLWAMAFLLLRPHQRRVLLFVQARRGPTLLPKRRLHRCFARIPIQRKLANSRGVRLHASTEIRLAVDDKTPARNALSVRQSLVAWARHSSRTRRLSRH